jgi:hypothetical protein
MNREKTMITKPELLEDILYVLSVVFLILLVISLTGFVVLFLWNSIVPDIFGLPRITFLQAIGLFFLFEVLFKSNYNFKNNK